MDIWNTSDVGDIDAFSALATKVTSLVESDGLNLLINNAGMTDRAR